MSVYIIGFAILVILNLNKYAPSTLSHGIYNIFCYGRRDYVWMGVSGISVIVGCYTRIKGQRLKAFVLIFLSITLMRYSLLPFIHPMVAYTGYARSAHTVASIIPLRSDVFIQSTDYTCGPAALITALNHYGIPDTEENITMGTFANPYSGTQPEHIVNYVNSQHGGKLEAKFSNYVKDVDKLVQPGSIAITIIKSSLFYDHYVVILGENPDGDLMIGDPSLGKQKISRKDFFKTWRHQVITINPQS